MHWLEKKIERLLCAFSAAELNDFVNSTKDEQMMAALEILAEYVSDDWIAKITQKNGIQWHKNAFLQPKLHSIQRWSATFRYSQDSTALTHSIKKVIHSKTASNDQNV